MRLLGMVAFAWGCASTATALTFGWLLRTLGACEPAPHRPTVTDDDGSWWHTVPAICLRAGDPELDRRFALIEKELSS